MSITVYSKKNATQFVKFVRHFSIRNRVALLWFVRKAPGYGTAAIFAERAAIFAKHRNSANTQQFGERAAIRRTRSNSANAPHFHCKRCRNLQDGGRTAARPSKCSAFGVRKVAHMPPCFQVPLRHICCILFDVYRTFPPKFMDAKFWWVSKSIKLKGLSRKWYLKVTINCGY